MIIKCVSKKRRLSFFAIICLVTFSLSWNLFHSSRKKQEATKNSEKNVQRAFQPTNQESCLEVRNTTVSEGFSVSHKSSFEVLQAKRQAVLKGSCMKLGLAKTIPEDDERFMELITKTNLFYSDRHKIIACEIPKCGCTNFKKVLLAAEGIINVSDPSKISGSDAHEIAERKLRLKRVVNITEIRRKMNTYFKFIIVREPFTRLLSAYRNKIENPPPGQYTETSKYIHRAVANATRDRKETATFSEFIQYITDPSFKKDPHWDFFHSLCMPCIIPYDFIGNMETVYDDIPYVMDVVNISGLKFPKGYSRNERTDDEKLAKYFGNFSSDIIDKLYETYKMDYDLFGYSRPLQ